MTLKKTPSPASSLRNSVKKSGKRAVSFSHSTKHQSTGKSTIGYTTVSDSSLQSIDKRRRYLRRGSKSASMLMMTDEQKQSLESCSRNAEATKPLFDQHKHRRLSLMSALKANLEKASLFEPEMAREIRRMSIDKQRSLTYELLSKV